MPSAGEPWRALVVGCGRIAGGFNRGPADRDVRTHALAYRRHPGFTLAACVDPDDKARRAFKRRWSVPSAYAALDEALAAERFDIASVCVPTASHLAVLRELMPVGLRAVFAEKPLGGDAAGAAALVDAYAQRGIALAVNFSRRWDPAMTALRDEIAGGTWGSLRVAYGTYGRGIVNNGSHLVDLAAFLLGEMVHPVAALRFTDDGVEGDPTVDAVLRFDRGALLHLAGNDGRDQVLFELSLVFAGGVVSIEESGRHVRRRPAQAVKGASIGRPGRGRWTPGRGGEAMLRALDELRAWRPGGPLASDGRSALAAIGACAALRSMAPIAEVV